MVIVYLLLVSGMLPGFGRLGDLRGHKPVYIAGFVLFIASSLLCALSPTVFALIGARAVQSLAAAMLSANSPAILTKTFPSSERGKALGLQATMTYLGLITGPSLGWPAHRPFRLAFGFLDKLAGGSDRVAAQPAFYSPGHTQEGPGTLRLARSL